MKDLGKIVVVSTMVSVCVVIGGNFGRNIGTNKIPSLERRVAHLEQCKDAHRDLIDWMLRNHFGCFCGYEITPETIEILDGEICEPCRNGWASVECSCKCKHKTVETGRYFLTKKGGAK